MQTDLVTRRYHEFCDKYLPNLDEMMVEYISSDEFGRLLIETVKVSFPAHEQRQVRRALPRPS